MTAVNRLGMALVLAGVLLMAVVSAAAAQGTDTDPRWHAWLGCWSPYLGAETAAVGLTDNTRVCIVPAAVPQAVDLVTIAADQIVSRDQIQVTGARRDVQTDGCRGWEQAEWSADGRRMYRRSEAECAGGVKRNSTQVFAMSPQGEWLDLISAALGPTSGVRIGRYQAATTPSSVLSAEARAALGRRNADITQARTALMAPVATTDVIDISKHASPVLAQAWLGEMGQTFDVTGRTLIQLADAGVPGGVTDLLVAMSYPDAFEVRPSSTSRSGGWSGGGGSAMSDADIDQLMNDAYRAGRNGLVNCSPFDISWGGCYSHFAHLAYGGWYMGAQPIVVVPVAPSGGAGDGQTHGQLVKGKGYVEGGGSSARSGSAESSGGSSSSSSSSSSSGSSGGGSSSSSSSGGSEPRTAHPR